MDVTTAALLKSLEAQRAHVLGAAEQLDAASLRKPVLPSGWSCLGLVQHLAVDVERFWFGQVMAGEPFADASQGEESAWTVAPETPPDEVLGRYRAEIERANDVIGTTALDAAPSQWPDFFGDWRLPDLRAVLLHVITETACHAGHLDAARELLDGSTWLVLD